MTHESDTPPRRDWRENARFAANIVNSLAIPLLTVAATIDEIKQHVPIWKNEHYADGESGWLHP